jgi:hypothetical protein
MAEFVSEALGLTRLGSVRLTASLFPSARGKAGADRAPPAHQEQERKPDSEGNNVQMGPRAGFSQGTTKTAQVAAFTGARCISPSRRSAAARPATSASVRASTIKRPAAARTASVSTPAVARSAACVTAACVLAADASIASARVEAASISGAAALCNFWIDGAGFVQPQEWNGVLSIQIRVGHSVLAAELCPGVENRETARILPGLPRPLVAAIFQRGGRCRAGAQAQDVGPLFDGFGVVRIFDGTVLVSMPKLNARTTSCIVP